MREIVLVMPCETGKQKTACLDIHVTLAKGGVYSVYKGYGAGSDENGRRVTEEHERFVVAVLGKYTANTLINVLRRVAREAGEQSIYYVDFEGEAHVETLDSSDHTGSCDECGECTGDAAQRGCHRGHCDCAARNACPARDGAPGDGHVYEGGACVFCSVGEAHAAR